jgi:uncharacterized membrane protein YbhN (UPF0104 family)
MATIVIDRMVGLLGLVIIAAAAVWGLDTEHRATLDVLVRGLGWMAALLVGLLAVVIWPRYVPHVLVRWLVELPLVGPAIHRLFAAAFCYARRRWVLMAAVGLSVTVHLLIGLAVFLGSRALFPSGPTLREHLVITPIANVAGALPIAPMGLGQFEAAMSYLFDVVPVDKRGQGIGIVVALVYRLMTIAVAPIGILYYWLNRQLVRDLMAQEDSHRQAVTR